MENQKKNWAEMRCLSFRGMPFKVTLNSVEQAETDNPKISLLDNTEPAQERTDRSDETHGRYHIFAYSFPEGSLNQKAVFGLIGQMILYLTEVLKAKDKDLLEATFCLILDQKPETLMKQLEAAGIAIEETSAGIYDAGFPFRFKIIVTEDLPEDEAAEAKSLIKYLEENRQ